MNWIRPISIIAILMFIGCKENQTTQDQAQLISETTLDSLSKQKVNLSMIQLASDADENIDNIEDFNNLKSMISTLNRSNSFYIQRYADSLEILIDTFKESLNTELKSNPIKSRITVLETEAGLLKQLSLKRGVTDEELLEKNKHSLIAFNSLIIQINELTLAIPETIEQELLKDFEILKDTLVETTPSIE